METLKKNRKRYIFKIAVMDLFLLRHLNSKKF
jgi:hypothetical protein